MLLYIVGFSFGYHVIYKSKQIEDEHGWTRPWTAGKALANKWFSPVEAYSLCTDEEFEDKHNKKFMGEGERIINVYEW